MPRSPPSSRPLLRRAQVENYRGLIDCWLGDIRAAELPVPEAAKLLSIVLAEYAIQLWGGPHNPNDVAAKLAGDAFYREMTLNLRVLSVRGQN